MNNVILLLGGNLGDRTKLIQEAKNLISQNNCIIVKESSLYESEPWGFNHAQNFINQIIEIETEYEPEFLLQNTQKIEKTLGRKAKTKTGYEGRTMDIDILFFNHQIIHLPNLIIPHPELHNRKFTLLPLAEKWDDFIHPVFQKTSIDLLESCKDTCWARILS